ncbi:hypothetical protein ACFX12_028571 [Malus domestica]
MFLDSLAALHRYLPSNESDSLAEDSDVPMNPISCDQFRMFEFKVRRCAHGRSHDWTDCPYAHPGEKARRRDPRKYHYSGAACPDFRKGHYTKGDSCEFAHGVFECWLHPAWYRTQPCKNGLRCNRRVCLFTHTPEQLRVLPGQSPRTQASGALDSYPFVPIPFPPLDPDLLPEGAEATVDLPFENTANLKIAYDLLQKPIKQFIADRLPDWIITDFAAHWVVEIGKDGNTDDILPSPESLTSPPDLVTSQSTVAYQEHEVVHTHAGLYRVNDSGISDAERHTKILSACRVYAIRSCYEFEGEYLEAYKNNSGKLVIPTGLLPPEIPAKGGNFRSFNLGGMGCSAGVIAVDLAKDLLQIHRNTYAVVVSTENITQNWYFGNKKSMLIPNCLFRVGGSAVLLSNKSVDRRRAKYKLVHVVRTHRGADDKTFRCVYQEQDDKGKTGVSLSKDLTAIAGGALETNITTLGPIVLPISEQLLFFSSLVVRKLFKSNVNTSPDRSSKLDPVLSMAEAPVLQSPLQLPILSSLLRHGCGL